jgi:glycosyltransferase involved in cell wall biosynthesis
LRNEYDYKRIPTSGRVHEFPFSVQEIRDKITGDVLIARKPKVATFGVSLLHQLSTDIPIILDIEDWELGLMYANWSRFRAPIAGIPRLFDLDSYYYTGIMEAVVDHADKVIVSNSFLQNKFGGTLIPHIRDTKAFDPGRFDKQNLRAQFDLPDQDVLIGFIGTPRPHKGVTELAKAISKFDRDDVKLLIVGDSEGEYVQKVRECAKEKIIFAGAQPYDDIPKWVAVTDIIASPQKQTEGLHGQIPAKVFDAMTMGKPVIATAISDLPEMLEDCGIVIEQPSSDYLYSALCDLIDNDDKRRKFGQVARERAVEQYSMERFEPVVENILSDL